MPDRGRLALEWFAHGERDFQAAKALLAQGGFTDTIAMLVQQAAEKYLKGAPGRTGYPKAHITRGGCRGTAGSGA